MYTFISEKNEKWIKTKRLNYIHEPQIWQFFEKLQIWMLKERFRSSGLHFKCVNYPFKN